MTVPPKGWTFTTLGGLGNYWNGRGFKKSEWRPPGQGRQIIRIQDLTGSHQKPNYFDGSADERHVARKGDILISWAATLGVFEWTGPEAVINQHIFKLGSFINRRFHRYLIESVLDDLRRRSHGTGMVHVTRNIFDETPVCLPPLAEQERIVGVIEEQFSRLDDAISSLHGVRRRLPGLRRAVLALAVASGEKHILGDLLEDIVAGKSFRTSGRPAHSEEWGVIKVSAMTWGRFLETENKAVPPAASIDPRFEIRPGDLLLSRANTSEYVGATVYVERCRPRLLLSDKSMRLIPAAGVDRRWLNFALNSPYVRRQMSLVATGTSDSMRNISQEKVRRLDLRMPPVSAQRAVIDEIERRLTLIDSLNTAIDHALIRSGSLRRAILDRAFCGGLVSQDPNDEPASALLDRVGTDGDRSSDTRRRRKQA